MDFLRQFPLLILKFGKMREYLAAHGSGLEGAAWLQVFEFKEDLAVRQF